MQKFLRLVLVVFTANFCRAEIPEDKRSEILKLFEVTHVLDVFDMQKAHMIEIISKQFPETPREVWDAYAKELTLDSYKEELVLVFDRNLSFEDLKAINSFYASPAGRRYAEKTMLMTQEAGAALRRLGNEAAQRVLQRYK